MTSTAWHTKQACTYLAKKIFALLPSAMCLMSLKSLKVSVRTLYLIGILAIGKENGDAGSQVGIVATTVVGTGGAGTKG